MLVAALKPESRERALELVHQQQTEEPIAPRQGIFLSESVVVFFFEGPNADEAVRQTLNDPVRSTDVSPWLTLFDGPLHRAPEVAFSEQPGR